MHDGDAVAEAHGLDLVVGDVDGGRPALLENALQLGAHLQAEQRVEIGERLVHEQHIGLHGERAGDRDALALAAGELAGIALEQLFDMHERGRALHLLPDLGLRQLLHPEAEGDVFEHRQMREDGVVLEHHGDAAGARRQVVDALSADANVAAARVCRGRR